jgi:hypothetical protein
VRWGFRWSLGFVFGALLSWLNYRLLKQGVATIIPAPASALCQMPDATVQQPAQNSLKVPVKGFAKFFGRYILLAAALYVILAHSLLPAAPFFAGLFVVVAAVLAELLYQLFILRV